MPRRRLPRTAERSDHEPLAIEFDLFFYIIHLQRVYILASIYHSWSISPLLFILCTTYCYLYIQDSSLPPPSPPSPRYVGTDITHCTTSSFSSHKPQPWRTLHVAAVHPLSASSITKPEMSAIIKTGSSTAVLRVPM